jgi:GTP-binding protein
MRDEALFFDEAKIFVQAGDGGNGCVSFRREKFVPHGGPDGGHGGNGGNVVLVVNPRLNTLLGFRKRAHFRAPRGAHGQGSNKQGKSGEDLIIRVPPGTLVRDAATGEFIADLVDAEARTVVAKAGRGGRGNSAFASSTHQAPRWAEKGEPGESRWILLELKLLADAGIIGAPNAGKSTLLASVTAARPKIADYPFTTLVPNLGVAVVDDREIVLADIPGLIEGAHAGAGLGDKFLRHVERTRVLMHLLDGALDDPLATFETINHELAQYNPRLASKPQIVALNKMDLPDAQARWSRVQKAMMKHGIDAFAISAATGQGVRELLRAVAEKLAEMPKELPKVEEELPVIHPEQDENAFEVSREGHAFRIRGKKAERVVAMTNFDQEEAILRLHRVFKAMGITAALEEAGVREGDKVRIGEVELEWRE